MDAVDKILAKHKPSVDDILARVGGGKPPETLESMPQLSRVGAEITPHAGDPSAPMQRLGARAEGIADQGAGAINSNVDTWSLGLWGAAMRLAQKLNETGVGKTVNAGISRFTPNAISGESSADAALQSMAQYRSEHPLMRIATDAPAYLFNGPTNALAAGVDRLLPRVVSGGLTGTAAKLSRNALASAGTSGAVTAANEWAGGKAPWEALPEIAHAAGTGLAIGAGAGMAGTMLGGAARKVLGSRGAQAREFIEKRGGEVGPATPGRGGPLQGSPSSPTDADIGASATAAADNAKTMLREYQDRVAGQPYREAVERVTPGMANRTLEISPIYKGLIKAANDPANLSQVGKLRELVGMIDQHRVVDPNGGRPAFIVTEEWLNNLRRGIGTISGVGETTSPRLGPLQRAFREVKTVVDEGPYAEANAAYHRGMNDVDESLGMAGLRRSHNPDEPFSGNLRVKAQRLGQNTPTAGAERDQMAAFREKHPDIGLELDQPELLRAKADLGFNLLPPAHGGLLNRLAAPAGATTAAVAGYMGHGLKGLAAIPLALAAQNATPIAGRLLYGPAQEAALAAPMLGHRTDLLQAIRRAHEENRP